MRRVYICLEARSSFKGKSAPGVGDAAVGYVMPGRVGLRAQAVLQYQRLAALLRGDHPRGLLPPVPRGYIAFRLRDLAVGSCVGQFTWNSGGAWLGKPWSPELLTDSALVFYLFAAFLEVCS